MKRVIVAILLSLLLPIYSVTAKPIKEEKAKRFAKNWVLEKWNKKADEVNIKEKVTGEQYGTDETLYYVLSFPQKGWMIVSGDDVAYPVIAFSPTGIYSDQDRPIQFEEWMENVKKDISSAIKAKHTPSPKSAAAWKRFGISPKSFVPDMTSSFAGPSFAATSVESLVSAEWGQGKYYNQKCPDDSSGPDDHALVGCVAVAMGQIMKYHSYPSTGSGSHSYHHPTYGWLSADFGDTTYKWTSMPKSLSDDDSDVAKLLYHVGVSVNMDYGPDSSSAEPKDIAGALITFFNYSSSARLLWRKHYSTSEWTALLRTELDNKRPVLYGGYGSGGHAFVCDGYSGSNYFHFNWGWEGDYDGYFYLNDLTPGGSNYSYNQAAVIGITPPGESPGSGDLPDFITDKVIMGNKSGSKEKYRWQINETAYVHAWVDNIGDADWEGTAKYIKVPFYLSHGKKEDAHDEWERVGREQIKKQYIKVKSKPKHEKIKFDLAEWANESKVLPGRTYNFVVCADRPKDENNGDGDVKEKHKSNNPPNT
ncbi:MAG: hypothetical protein D3908_08405, partial [Candidatus Electrothrix sp. AUS4]|nr:hypothetical protein [Candidatus Electrothrix sp. AUS4]